MPVDFIELSVEGNLVRFGRPSMELQLLAAERLHELRNQRFEEEIAGCATLQGESLYAALSIAFERHQAIVTDREIANWLETPAGTVFILWHALRKFRGSCREEDARNVYESLTVYQLELLARFFATGRQGDVCDSSNPADTTCEVCT